VGSMEGQVGRKLATKNKNGQKVSSQKRLNEVEYVG